MTIYTPNSSGNWGTSSIWDTVAQASNAGATANVTTAGLNTETWTAPNTTNFITGAWICMLTAPAAGRDFTLELFQSGVATGNITTILQSDMPATNGADAVWIYFKLAVPFQYTTTAAGAYRFQLKSTVANSGTVYNNSGATGVLVYPTDDRHAVPSGANQVMIPSPNCNTNLTVTVDGARDVTGGTGISGSQPVVRNAAQSSIIIGGAATKGRAKLVPDTSADSTLTFSGHCAILAGGAVELGTLASPYPSSFVATLQGNPSSTTNAMVSCYGNGYINAVSGRTFTFTRTTYSSGLGTAASPLITADAVDWNVGDKICVGASSNNATNYNEAENRFIITKNSSTSYVLSSTKGGAENALVNSHTNAVIANLTRGVVFQNTNATGSISFNFEKATTDDSIFEWCNLNNIGAINGSPTVSVTFPPVFGIWAASARSVSINHCVFDLINAYGWILNQSTPATFSDNIFANSISNNSLGTLAGLGITTSAVGHTFDDFLFINNQRQAVEYHGVNCTFNNPELNSCNKLGLANQGGFQPQTSPPFVMNDAEMHCNRGGAFAFNGAANCTINRGNYGTKGYNTVEVAVAPNTANTNILFDSIIPGSPTLVSGHTAGAAGATEFLFNKLNNTANRHVWYSEYGSAQSTGAGLPDTTVRTAGTLNVRIAPENSATGFSWEYLVPAVPGNAVQSFLFLQKNAAFGTDTAKVELFLPGSTVADATATASNTTGQYLVLAVAANYAGTENLYARIRVTAQSVTAGAYIYVADISNGTNDIINLKTWYRAKPSSIMFEQLGDAGAVWAYLLDGSFTAAQIMKILAAVMGGKVSGAGTGTETFRNLPDTINRVVATVDANGNRTAITRDLS